MPLSKNHIRYYSEVNSGITGGEVGNGSPGELGRGGMVFESRFIGSIKSPARRNPAPESGRPESLGKETKVKSAQWIVTLESLGRIVMRIFFSDCKSQLTPDDILFLWTLKFCVVCYKIIYDPWEYNLVLYVL